jgi:hypothetical protein
VNNNFHIYFNSLRISSGFTLGTLLALQAMVFSAAWGQGNPDRRPEAGPSTELYLNASGVLETVNINGRTDTRGAFFQSLGTNGRDPLFAAVDGANCSDIRRQDRDGHSLLLKHGLIRIGIGIPATAQFTISVVHDPYGCALVSDPGTGLLTVNSL